MLRKIQDNCVSCIAYTLEQNSYFWRYSSRWNIWRLTIILYHVPNLLIWTDFDLQAEQPKLWLHLLLDLYASSIWNYCSHRPAILSSQVSRKVDDYRFQWIVDSTYSLFDIHDEKCAFETLHHYLYGICHHLVHCCYFTFREIPIPDHTVLAESNNVCYPFSSWYSSQRDDLKKEPQLRKNSECSNWVNKWLDK